MEQKNFLQSKTFTRILYGVGFLAIALLIFQAGVEVGYHKAAFSYRFGEYYYQTFGGNPGGVSGLFHDDIPPSEGVIGKILRISLPSVVIEGQDAVERVVTIDDDTAIRHLRDAISPASLTVGDYVVVVGLPENNGQMAARLIRVVPPPPPSVWATTSPASN